MIKIGNVLIEKTAALAPMAGVADVVYRNLCKHFGACYVTSEMVSAKGIVLSEKLNERYLLVTNFQRPMAIQLFGSEPEFFEQAIYKVLKHKPDIVDLNMGCPVNKVVKRGAGCALMKNLKLAEKIAKVVVKNSNVAVTVKIRSGWDENSVNAVEFAKLMESCGVSAITVHARTRNQFYSGRSDWNLIRQVKKNVKIPVIASGDVDSALSCKMCYEKTEADLVTIGRASFGHPWIFKEIKEYLKYGKIFPNCDVKFKMDVLLKHIRDLCAYYGEENGMKKARFVAISYFNGFKHAAKFRKACCEFQTFKDAEILAEKACSLF